ncbi:hypothetical protein AgCh_033875 [Apium graveolens]
MTDSFTMTVDILSAAAATSSDDDSNSSEYEYQDKDVSSSDDEKHSPLPVQQKEESDDDDDSSEDNSSSDDDSSEDNSSSDDTQNSAKSPTTTLTLPSPKNTQEEEEETDDDDDDDDSSDDTQKSPITTLAVFKPSFTMADDDEEETDDDDDDDDYDSSDDTHDSAKTTLAQPVSLSPHKTLPKPSLSVSKYQQMKRHAANETLNIDKVSRSKKMKLSNADGQICDKGKKVATVDEEGAQIKDKKGFFKWSHDDVVVLFDAMLHFKANTGKFVVTANLDVFYEGVKDLFSANLTKDKLYDKIKKLKKKFASYAESGEKHMFLRPHEYKLFDISKNIWGTQGSTTKWNNDKVKTRKIFDKKDGNLQPKSVASKEETSDAVMEDTKEQTQDYWSLYSLLCASLESEASSHLTQKIGDLKGYVKKMISGFGEDKARELEEGWEAVHMMNLKLYVKKVTLIHKQAQVVMDSLKIV